MDSSTVAAGNAALMQEAEVFIRTCYQELGKSADALESRMRQIEQEISRDGTYMHTYEELAHGARMAWRNSNRCIGRLFWNRLHVFDERGLDAEEAVFGAHGLDEEEAVFDALVRHIEFATNGGEIRPAITVFRQAGPDGREPVRVWNHQLLRYAGYEQPDGSVLGDPASVALTKVCQSLGWNGAGTAFDVLPLVVQCDGRPPRVFELPGDIVLEVPIRHPELDLFAAMGIKWYAVPIISDMRLEIGGISYAAAPFNGWYMGTEIGARNLADEFRYNLLPRVAEAMGLNTASPATLWKDRALVELNVAVLHSFREDGVSIVDHHTAAQQFAAFQKNEERAGRELTGQWSWLIPPVSPATTHIFHSAYEDRIVSPNFYVQPRLYGDE